MIPVIPLFSPSGGQQAHEALGEIFAGPWWGKGPVVTRFEAAFAEYLGVPAEHVIALNSCTSALQIALRLADIGPGDEVLVPTMTFCSDAHVVCMAGARPVFVDIDPDTLLFDWRDALRKTTDKTKAVIYVHFAGWPADISPEGDVRIIEDCAHACGATLFPGTRFLRRVGASGTCCFSFHAVKNLACGDGGAIVVPDRKDADRARRLSWLGLDRSTYERAAKQAYSWEYGISELGYKAHMIDVLAAVALSQLATLDARNEERRRLASIYDQQLVRQIPRPVGHAMHLYWVRHPHARQWERALADSGIQTGLHYRPLNLYPVYGPYQPCPVAESLWQDLITLPCWPGMTHDQVFEVCEAIREAEGQY